MADPTQSPAATTNSVANTPPPPAPPNQQPITTTPYMPTPAEHLLAYNLQAKFDARAPSTPHEIADLYAQKHHIFALIAHRYRQEFFHRNVCQNCHELPGQPPGPATAHVRMRTRPTWRVLQEVDHMYVPGEVLALLIKGLNRMFIAAESTYMFEAKLTECGDGRGMYRARV